jgi:NAD(P)-dependent dehydrogenase (short-subunit alcohol dehydrogenase family)
MRVGRWSLLLTGQVAVVTGGGRGIGRAIAKRFAAEGAAVVVSARTQKEIEQVALEIQDAGGKAASVAGDVAREPDCEKLYARRATLSERFTFW